MTVSGARSAFTLVELLVVMSIIALLASLLLTSIAKSKPKAQRLVCVNQLRQIGMAFNSFAHDHQDSFPTQLSTNLGGIRELAPAEPALTSEIPEAFGALSNELVTPRLLHCPTDTRLPAAHFSVFTNSNLSYFVGLQASLAQPGSILAGDRNVKLFNDRLQWTNGLHVFKGNLLFADTHVEQRSSWRLPETLVVASPPPESPPGEDPTGPPPPTAPAKPLPRPGTVPPKTVPNSPMADPSKTGLTPPPANPPEPVPDAAQPAHGENGSKPAAEHAAQRRPVSPHPSGTQGNEAGFEQVTNEESSSGIIGAESEKPAADVPEQAETHDDPLVRSFAAVFPIWFGLSLVWALVLLFFLIRRTMRKYRDARADFDSSG